MTERAFTDTSALQTQLPLVRKPGQYAGLEHNAVQGALDEGQLNFCLIFPDLYEIGMSHQGLQILYHILNREEQFCAHRAYTPDTDMEALLRRQGLPLFALESGAPLADYDVLGITLPYELCYTNILTVLDLAGLPLRSQDRDDKHPLVIGGGSCAFNPEPMADFFDAILLGDGEEAILSIANILLTAKKEKTGRAVLLKKLATVQGVYVPALFKPQYSEENGRFASMEALDPGYSKVRRAILASLDSGALQHQPLVPAVKPVHDRLAMEIARGCTRGCRFCQAGMLYRPVRERSMQDILDWADKGIKSSGFEEMALLSLSTGDYSCLDELVLTLMNRFSPRRVSLSMPSMRVGTLSPAIMEQIRRVRKTGFTVAPEAGSERLRQVINKGITEQDLLDTCRNAFSLGWNLIKFYFMTGLPTETEEDVAAIAALVRKAKAQAQGKTSRSRGVQINVGVGTFVPKAHTPFQWEAQLSLAEARERINLLKRLLPPKGFKLKWHDPEQSYLEGVFARGDRRLSTLIEAAWRKGARLDSWGEHFNLGRWQDAAQACGIDLDDYLRKRSPDEVLPWDHLDCGVERDYLLAERERALAQQYTPDCRTDGCQGCGICDFKTVQPVLHPNPAPAAETATFTGLQKNSPQGTRLSYRVQYSRQGASRLLGHLELLQLIFRVLRRADMPLAYTQGFNPTPKVSFSQALPVGMESMAEYFDMELLRPIHANTALVERLNRELPPGLRVQSIGFAPKKNAACSKAAYEILLQGRDTASLADQAASFLAQDSFPITRLRKNRETTFDMRPLVASIQIEEDTLLLELLHHQGLPGVNPREVLERVFGLSQEEALLCRIIKRESVDMPVPA
ncbi:MAG: TIGR03960 family B12-binding radical SAM protein [Desulfobulbaceae bacterium]|nr:TIGR03960 family B12-binding radical SAM protein [Desulfobulbaceae bacterium]